MNQAVLSTEPPFPVESQGNPRTPCGFLPNPSKGQWDSYHIPSSFPLSHIFMETYSWWMPTHSQPFLLLLSRLTSPVFYTHAQLAAPFMLLSFQACMVVWYCLCLQ